MVNNNEILSHIIDIKTNVSAINEHLKTLNGKVATNVNNIEKNRSEIIKTKITLAKYSAGIVVAITLIQLGIKFLI